MWHSFCFYFYLFVSLLSSLPFSSFAFPNLPFFFPIVPLWHLSFLLLHSCLPQFHPLTRSLLFPPGSVYIPANLSLLSLSFFLLSRSPSPILSQSISADAFFLSIASNISSNCPFSLCLCRPKNARPNMELSHKSIDRNSSAMECSTQSPCINILFKTDTNVPCSCVVE